MFSKTDFYVQVVEKEKILYSTHTRRKLYTTKIHLHASLSLYLALFWWHFFLHMYYLHANFLLNILLFGLGSHLCLERCENACRQCLSKLVGKCFLCALFLNIFNSAHISLFHEYWIGAPVNEMCAEHTGSHPLSKCYCTGERFQIHA